MHPAQPGRLDSWKAIAEYLGRNVRTVTRWADERGLPVRRVPGGKRGAVFAYAEEVDAWLSNAGRGGSKEGLQGINAAQGKGHAEFGDTYLTESGSAALHKSSGLAGQQIDSAANPIVLAPPEVLGQAQSSAPLPKRRFQAVAWRIAMGAVVLAVFASLIARVLHPWNSQASQLFSIKFGADRLEGQDAQGRSVWSYQYPEPIRERDVYSPGFYQAYRMADFLGDGKREAAVSLLRRSGPDPNDTGYSQLDFFSAGGKLLWRYTPNGVFQFGAHELKAPWFVSDMHVSQLGGGAALWVGVVHNTWGNGFVVEIDPGTGHDKLRFVNTGTIYPLNEISSTGGKFLLVGGFNNEWDGGSLAIINEDKPFAASPQTPGTRHHCDSCSPGDPDYYFVFPRSEINQVTQQYENAVTVIYVAEDGIRIVKSERFHVGSEQTVYLLESKPPFGLVSVRYNSDYDMLHRAWSDEGKLSHALEQCPERLHPQPVRLWTPGGGWIDVPVKPAAANQ
jgi:hypothetical protein